MQVYIYQAALYCVDCGNSICEDLTAAGKAPEDPEDEGSYDSDDFPKGPTDEGESDSPSHCDGCQCFLETDLTEEGKRYVIEAVQRARAEKRKSVAITEWEPFYDFEIPHVLTKLSDESTSDCTCGCGEPAFMYTAPGLDGYVDAAPGCAQDAITDALEDQDEPAPVDEQGQGGVEDTSD